MASARIRMYSLLKALPKDFSYVIVNDLDRAEEVIRECDLLYVQKAAWKQIVELCQRARALGKKIVYDIDDDFGVWPDMEEETLCALASVVTVDSSWRASLVRRVSQAPAHVIPCMIDLAEDPARRRPRIRKQLKTACTFGNHNSIVQAGGWLSALSNRTFSTFAVGPATAADIIPRSRFVQFQLGSFIDNLMSADLAVLRHSDDELGNRKDNNRLIMAMSLGIPAITSKTQAYVETLEKVGFSELACGSEGDFLKIVEQLSNRERRLEISARFYEHAWKYYSPERIAKLFTQALTAAFT